MYEPLWYEYLYLPLFLTVPLLCLIYLSQLKEK